MLGLVGGAPGGETPRVADSSAAKIGGSSSNILEAPYFLTLGSCLAKKSWEQGLTGNENC